MTIPPGPIALPKAAARGTRIFLGYEPAELRNLFSNFQARLLPPARAFAVGNAHLEPARRLSKGAFTGGVFSEDGWLTELGLYRGFANRRDSLVRTTAPSKSEILLKTGWFGGYLFSHYGHFLLEGLARIVKPTVCESGEPIVFFNMSRLPRLPGYAVAILDELGIDPGRIVLCDAPMTIGRLMVQPPGFEIRGTIRPSHYRTAKMRAESAHPDGFVYLSRSKLSELRVINGELDLEAGLATENGAMIVHPQDLSWQQQIAALANAKWVMGCEGSALHTLIFRRQVEKTIILCAGAPHVNYLLCDELFNGTTYYVKAISDRIATNPRAEWTIDASKIKAHWGEIFDARAAQPQTYA